MSDQYEEGEQHEPEHHEPEHGAPPHGKGKAGDFFARHKVEIIAAAVGVAVTVYLYIRSKDAATTPTSPATGTETSDTGATGATGATGQMGVSPKPVNLAALEKRLEKIINHDIAVSSHNVSQTKAKTLTHAQQLAKQKTRQATRQKTLEAERKTQHTRQAKRQAAKKTATVKHGLSR